MEESSYNPAAAAADSTTSPTLEGLEARLSAVEARLDSFSDDRWADKQPGTPDNEQPQQSSGDRLQAIEEFLQRQFGRHNFDVVDNGQAQLPQPQGQQQAAQAANLIYPRTAPRQNIA